MTKTPWTPGPWHVDAEDPSDVVVWAIDETLIGNVWKRIQLVDVVIDVDIANARLIAAAPDLYEALVAICITAAQLGATDMELDIARTALVKARGEE